MNPVVINSVIVPFFKNWYRKLNSMYSASIIHVFRTMVMESSQLKLTMQSSFHCLAVWRWYFSIRLFWIYQNGFLSFPNWLSRSWQKCKFCYSDLHLLFNWPPKSISCKCIFHSTIFTSSTATHHMLCIVYFNILSLAAAVAAAKIYFQFFGGQKYLRIANWKFDWMNMKIFCKKSTVNSDHQQRVNVDIFSPLFSFIRQHPCQMINLHFPHNPFILYDSWTHLSISIRSINKWPMPKVQNVKSEANYMSLRCRK